MSFLNRVRILKKTIRQLGFKPVALLGIYRLGVVSGFYRLRTPARKQVTPFRIPTSTPDIIRNFGKHGWNIPSRQTLQHTLNKSLPGLIAEADEIVNGQVRLFGADPVPLRLTPGAPLKHWSLLSDEGSGNNDIKLTWEPARLGWAFTLGRAYVCSGDEKYAEAFWKFADEFLENNPANLGPNWASGQEIGLRILAFCFALQVFQYSPHSTLARQAHLIKSIREHAGRIPATLIYAGAQNNNHLLTETAALYTAAILLPHLPAAAHWKKVGWQGFIEAIQAQIQEDGTYIQQSMNYHRLMLQVALWVKTLGEKNGEVLPVPTLGLLAAAANWLLAQIDPISGNCPNLGHNDGANIFPLSSSEYSDYRPVGQAVAAAFLGRQMFTPGAWDEFSLWLGLSPDPDPGTVPALPESPSIAKIKAANTWATMRCVKFTNRPAHADQLQVDLWWQGLNIALDAGTYRYTAPSPWNNALMNTGVHNTVLVEETNQMERAGRFLWLDWAQSRRCPGYENENTIVAEHDGYKRLGCIHRRSLAFNGTETWTVRDFLLPTSPGEKTCRASINWLIPDGKWKLDGSCLSVELPIGVINVNISMINNSINPPGITTGDTVLDSPVIKPGVITSVQLIRAGISLVGARQSADEILGWYSPTYNKKIPALSFKVSFAGRLPLAINSQWILSSE